MTTFAKARIAGVLTGVALVAGAVTACGSDTTDDSAASSAPTVSSSHSAVSTTRSESSAAPSSEPSAPVETSTTTGDGEVQIDGQRDVDVTLRGPIATKYSSATKEQKARLGLALTGDHNAETRESGVVFQQFEGGVIVAANDGADTPAYILWGDVRDAWNVERDAAGRPSKTGTNGSAGPLGVPTSDVEVSGGKQQATFEHGKVVYDEATDKAVVTVNGKTVPSGL